MPYEDAEAQLRREVADSRIPPSALDALEYERAQWAHGSAGDAAFYQVGPETAHEAPGTLLKVEERTDIAKHALPPGVSMSRIIYQTEDLLGQAIPASALLLWPFCARRTGQEGRIPLVVWAHGTTGGFVESAPSNFWSLGQQFMAPVPLVLNGYAVFAPDYAGLGVGTTGAGAHIVHEYCGNPAQANDVVYGVQAVRKAFEELSQGFIVTGHSQGGGAAWSTAQREAGKPTEGYLGAIAICPVTNFLDVPPGNPLIPVMGALASPAIKRLYPSFQPSDILTQKGLERWKLYQQLRGSFPLAVALLTGDFELAHPLWRQDPTLLRFVEQTSNGGKPIAGPLLVIQGEEDPAMSCVTTEQAVQRTLQQNPSAKIKLVKLPRAGHDESVYVSQPLWLQWIERRFAGDENPSAVLPSVVSPPRPAEAYQASFTWYLERPTRAWNLVY